MIIYLINSTEPTQVEMTTHPWYTNLWSVTDDHYKKSRNEHTSCVNAYTDYLKTQLDDPNSQLSKGIQASAADGWSTYNLTRGQNLGEKFPCVQHLNDHDTDAMTDRFNPKPPTGAFGRVMKMFSRDGPSTHFGFGNNNSSVFIYWSRRY